MVGVSGTGRGPDCNGLRQYRKPTKIAYNSPARRPPGAASLPPWEGTSSPQADEEFATLPVEYLERNGSRLSPACAAGIAKGPGALSGCGPRPPARAIGPVSFPPPLQSGDG